MKKAVIILSGGLDSACMMSYLKKGYQLYGVTFAYGQRASQEIKAAKRIAKLLKLKEHKILDISFMKNLYGESNVLTSTKKKMPEKFNYSIVVPIRNAVFLSIASAWAFTLNAELVAYGAQKGDTQYPDCRPEFYKAIHEAFAVGNWDSEKVDLYLPYLEGDKLTILRDAQESIAKLQLDFNTVFRNTSTSYDTDDQGRASGKTGSDVERILAFHELGVPDPVPYAEPWETVLQNALDLQEKHTVKPNS